MTAWKPAENGCLRRADGAMVFPRKTMWGAGAPGDRGEVVGRIGIPRRWKTAEAAMLAVDREFPCSPPEPRFPALARRHMAALKLSTAAWIMGHG